MTPSEKHNQLSRDFVTRIAAQTDNSSEMMVVIESVILATLLILKKRDGFTAAGSAQMIETAIQAAVERFVAMEAGR